jgi:hypothetical protein
LPSVRVYGQALFSKAVFLVLFSVVSLAAYSQTEVSSLTELIAAVKLSDQEIVMTPGDYNFKDDLDSDSRYIECSGSNNTITLTGVYIEVPVGCVDSVYFVVSGDNNSIIGGEIEDVYESGITEVTDFSAYNQDRTYLAHGLGGDPVMKVSGDDNTVTGLELTTRGSFPYGYGSMFGIGADNVFGLDKRCGILIQGNDNTLDSITLHHRAFGHGLFMQSGADGTLITNSYVEGRVRETADFYNDTNTYDLPYRTNYTLPLSDDNEAIPTDEVYSLCEDGIRMYSNTGTITVENCTVERMRGGIRLYLGGTSNVSDSKSTDCGDTNYNMSSSGVITNSSGNFNYSPLSDFRLSRSSQDLEWTVIPSPNAMGPHNLADVQGSNHEIVFHRTAGPKDTVTTRAIVISDDNSTILNETEYPIVLESTASGNSITSCGPVYDYGSDNTIVLSDCSPFGASDTIQAEDYTDMYGVETSTTTDDDLGDKVSSIDDGDWMEYQVEISKAGIYWLDYRVSGDAGDFILEVNDESVDTLTFDATDDDETWQTVRSNTAVYLIEGTNTLSINSEISGWNLNWIQLLPDCYDTDIEPYITTTNLFGVESEEELTSEATVYPGETVAVSLLPELGGSWLWSGPDEFTSTEREVTFSDIEKEQGGAYSITYTNDCGQTTYDTIQINVIDSLLFEAEEYDDMDGVTIETTSDDNGGSDVTSIESGDWVEYEIDVPFSALFTIDYRVASESNSGTFTTSVDGESIEQVAFESTGGAQVWTTVSSDSSIYLSEGVKTLKLSSESDGWNLNWIKLNVVETVRDCDLPYIDEGFTVDNETVEWSSGVMDITCASEFLEAHVMLESYGSLSASDYLNIYYIIDGGDTVSIAELTGDVDEMMASATELSGSTIEVIIQSKSGSEDAGYTISKVIVLEESDPFALIEAEDYDDFSGIYTEETSDTDGGYNVGSYDDQDWLMYSSINLTEVNSVDMRLATKYSDCTIEVRLDSVEGTLISTIDVPNTGGWQDWETASNYITDITGIYDVYLVFNSDNSYSGNINWLQFSETVIKRPTDPFERFEAEDNDGESGVSSITTTDVDGDEEVSDIEKGDYVMFSALDLEAADSVYARVASDSVGGVIEIRLGSTTGDIISFIDVPNTGSSSTWETVSAAVDDVDAEYDIYFVFRGDGSDLFRLNWLQFTTYENSFAKLESEDYDTISGSFDTDDSTDDEDEDGQILEYITSGNWIKFVDVDLTGAKSVDARYATGFSDSYIEVRKEDSEGELIGTIELESTGGLTKWETASAGISDQSDTCDICFVYQAESSSSVFCSNWFQFSELEIEESIDPSSRIEAEDYDRASGTVMSTTTDVDGEEELDSIEYGDWILFKNVDLTDLKSIDVRVASLNDNSRIEFRTGSYGGSLLTNVSISNTGSTSIWETASADLYSEMEGEYDVYLVFKGSTSSDDLLNINWLQFNSTSTGIAETNFASEEIQLFPNPVVDDITITGALGAKVVLYNILGNLISITSIESDEQTISMNELSSGYYLLKVIKSDGTIESFKVIKDAN